MIEVLESSCLDTRSDTYILVSSGGVCGNSYNG